jgi:hypothetical protein
MKRSIPPILTALALASTVATAQPIPGQGFNRIDIVKLLNLDEPRGAKVENILQAAHERMRAARAQIGRPMDDTTRATLHAAMKAIRDDTDRQLAEVLTPDELERLMAAMPRPQRAAAPAPPQ